MTVSFELRREASPTLHEPALRRALDASRDPSGEGFYEPWRLYVLHPEAAASVAWLVARHLEPEVGPEGARAAYEQWRAVPGWVAVTCPRPGADAERHERDREATLTAVQRASLSLWSDNIPTNWVPDLALDEPDFYRLIEADGTRELALGVMLYGHPEQRAF